MQSFAEWCALREAGRGSGTCLALAHLRSETRAAAVSKDDNGGGEGSEISYLRHGATIELHRWKSSVFGELPPSPQ